MGKRLGLLIEKVVSVLFSWWRQCCFFVVGGAGAANCCGGVGGGGKCVGRGVIYLLNFVLLIKP